tara:strand:- start:2534 stop:3187 length:654 start_codon:yes stop_codon:yes gene_type:complete
MTILWCYRRITPEKIKEINNLYTCSCCLEEFTEKPLYECINKNDKDELTCPKGFDSTYLCKDCVNTWINSSGKIDDINSNKFIYNCQLCRNNTLVKNKEIIIDIEEDVEETNKQKINTNCSGSCYYNCINNCNCNCTFDCCNNTSFRENKISKFLLKIICCGMIYILGLILTTAIILIFNIDTSIIEKWYYWILIIPSLIIGIFICIGCLKICDNIC